jgi:1-acyl-sn-glycerol-3-phosphate acyltransferase
MSDGSRRRGLATEATRPAPRPPGDRYGWWRFARGTIGLAFDTGFRLRFAGLANVPRSGGALLTYNHVSVLDPVVVALGADRRGRSVRFLALSEAFDQRFVGFGLRKTRQIPLRRGLGDWDAIQAVADAIRTGSLAGLSPEGTVGDGATLQPGQKGAARIALSTSAAVIPVGIWGIQARWPKAGLHLGRPLRPTVGVSFGPAMGADGDPRSRADVRDLTDRIMARLAEQVDVARILAS